MRQHELTELLNSLSEWKPCGLQSWNGARGFVYFNDKDDDNLGLEIQYDTTLGLRVNKFKRVPFNSVCVVDTDKLTIKNREQIRNWFDTHFGFG